MFSFTTIQTVLWRGFGLDRGAGYLEARLGLIGFAFVRGDLWSAHKKLRETCASYEQEIMILREELLK
ncbi:hypothetical protein [Neokomagataea anthophila]|uniref:Uncharacterized protein n=1 Tax=Neokomagataea anthophila TaxID=2826925 RepID=A0ABS5E832_9PROT|nr:hypothetical protein [Neokomagataea anthophila]MBR0560067.1 hypothetical protein [Neokomagataea anthophila]